ncbi:MAG: sialate O-acetylesterase [Pirellulales bacterium]
MLHDFFFPITLLLILTFPSTKARASEVVHVFILAGQSNMVGAGEVESNLSRNDGKGSLQWLTENSSTKDSYSHLKTSTGAWVQRDDVFIWFLDRRGPLEPGYGSNQKKIGPELGFGWTVGEGFDEPVLLIKLAWGGKSLAEDFRPPSLEGDTGPYYVEVIEKTKEILNIADQLFPELKGKTFELTGLGWHQGWNDRINQSFNDAYEKNMIKFIEDVRRDIEKPNLPFVIAETGMSGPEEKHPPEHFHSWQRRKLQQTILNSKGMSHSSRRETCTGRQKIHRHIRHTTGTTMLKRTTCLASTWARQCLNYSSQNSFESEFQTKPHT